jgi:hypothetical protein
LLKQSKFKTEEENIFGIVCVLLKIINMSASTFLVYDHRKSLLLASERFSIGETKRTLVGIALFAKFRLSSRKIETLWELGTKQKFLQSCNA